MNKFKEEINRRIARLKKDIRDFPNKVKKSCVDFGKNTIDSIKSTPKYFQHFYKRSMHNVISIPENSKNYFIKIKNYRWKNYKKILLNNGILISLLFLILYIIISNISFVQLPVFTDIINQSATKLIIALGAGTIIVAKGTDLSSGRVVGLTAMIGALFSQRVTYKDAFVKSLLGNNAIIIIIVTMLVGALIGLINGFIVAKLNVTPFIATLGTMLIAYGITIYEYENITNGQPIGTFETKYTDLTNKGIFIGKSGYISYITLISIALAFVMWILWTKLPFGRKMFAVGGNIQAAKVSGISASIVLLITYVIGGMLYGIAGSLEAWRTGSTVSGTGTMYELDAIAACIVGGLSFDGGKGKISGIILGVIIFQTITYGFAYMGFGTAMVYIIKGAIIVMAVAFDSLKNRTRI